MSRLKILMCTAAALAALSGPVAHAGDKIIANRPEERRMGADGDLDLERNKALVSRLFAIIYGTSLADIAKVDQLVAVDYIQHNPRATQGREGLKAFMKIIVPEPKELDPKDTLSVRYIAERDFVVRQEMRRNGMLVDIFRIENGLLKEHWDAFRFAPDATIVPGF